MGTRDRGRVFAILHVHKCGKGVNTLDVVDIGRLVDFRAFARLTGIPLYARVHLQGFLDVFEEVGDVNEVIAQLFLRPIC
jgi:hypothetical protein